MRRLFPDSLAAWALLTLIAGLIVVELSTLAAMVRDRDTHHRMTAFFHLAERVSSISRAVAAQDQGQRATLAATLSDPTLAVRLEAKPLATTTIAADDELAELEDILEARLADSGVTDIHVERQQRSDGGTAGGIARPDEDAGPVERGLFDIAQSYARDDSETYVASIALRDGSWLNFTIPMAPRESLWSPDTMALAAAVIAVVLAGSLWFLRRLTSPYRLLADAAERFGRDLRDEALEERGPRELRAASHAFNLMRERVLRLIADRDQLAAAISHDLRTPVTRLRLRAEFIAAPDQRARMLDDLDQIETMTRSVLAFAREAAEPEPRERIDLVSLVETLCDETPGAVLELAPGLPPRLPYSAQPVALRRCVANLVDNAVKYGQRARISVKLEPAAICILVEDDGPGLPEAEIENLFRPFRRLETSRNRETGGTGLGLTIARSVARTHGGDVVLANREAGGARATLTLPLAATAVLRAA